jgi:hypothetical protein
MFKYKKSIELIFLKIYLGVNYYFLFNHYFHLNHFSIFRYKNFIKRTKNNKSSKKLNIVNFFLKQNKIKN